MMKPQLSADLILNRLAHCVAVIAHFQVNQGESLSKIKYHSRSK